MIDPPACPEEFNDEQRAKWLSIAGAPRYSRTNDGGFVINSGDPVNPGVAETRLRAKTKRGQAYNADDAEGLANARLISAAPEMYQWLTMHYALEEGPGRTDRPQYEELRRILAKVQP